ncbi:MAG: hypothetical protein HY738_19860 [Bacteroidia bacterium]|nr:hypothetical protein [Bacteroidia bacterium]
MESILVKPKSFEEFQFISEILKRMKVKIYVLTEEEREDLGLIKLMKEADRTKKVLRDKIMEKLNRK